MLHRLLIPLASASIFALSPSALAGIYAPAAGEPGSTAIDKDDPAFVGWASQVVSFTRGPQDIANPGGDLASFGVSGDALGQAEGITNQGVVSLGDGGSITLGFDTPIADGPGADFAVFENGFADSFLELAVVEVSSNGTDFIRFDAVSQTQTDTQVGGFDTLDPTDLDNLAGKYRVGFGTPFDLSELADASDLLDINAVSYVRLIDVVGSIDPAYATLDSLGNAINDPYDTPFSSGGFDLDAVGVINVPEPVSAWGLLVTACAIASRRRRAA